MMAKATRSATQMAQVLHSNESSNLLCHLPGHTCAFAEAEAALTPQSPAVSCGCSQVIWHFTLYVCIAHQSLIANDLWQEHQS